MKQTNEQEDVALAVADLNGGDLDHIRMGLRTLAYRLCLAARDQANEPRKELLIRLANRLEGLAYAAKGCD